MPTDLESLNEKRTKRFHKVAIVATCVLVCTGLPAAWFGPPMYSRWQQHRLTGQAREEMAKGNYVNAAGRLRRVLGFNPDNIEAARLLAEMADKLDAPDAVPLHRHVSALRPDSFDDAFSWASSALKQGSLAEAGEALAIMKRTGPTDPRDHNTAGRVAAASGRTEEARDYFAKALAADPRNEQYQLDVAANALKSEDPAARAGAEKTLETLGDVPAFHLRALRALANDALARDQMNAAIEWEKSVSDDPHATFLDHLAYLDIMHRLHHPAFSSYLAELEAAASKNATDTGALVYWMNAHELAMVAAAWADTLPAQMISEPPAADEIATSYLLLLDWKRLRAFASKGYWGGSEFIREAFLARAARETGDQTGSDAHWSAAVALASKAPRRLPILERIASNWGWDEKREDLLWLIADTSENPMEALRTLARHYESLRDTRGLNRVWNKVVEIDPANVQARNNLTMSSLLLGLESDKTTKDAAVLAAKYPSDPDIVSTYAFALHLQGQPEKGIDLMRALKPEDLTRPTIAASYGLLLADKTSPDAPKYLAIAKSAPLPPEEEESVAEALDPSLRKQAPLSPARAVPSAAIEEPSPFKYVLHPMAEATPFKYVLHPDVPTEIPDSTVKPLPAATPSHSPKPTPAASPSSTHPAG